MSFTRTANVGAWATPSLTTATANSYVSVAGRPIVGFVAYEGTLTTLSVSDTAGNTYIVVASSLHPDVGQVVAAFYCLSSLGHASNVITATLGAARGYRGIQAAEYTADWPVAYEGYSVGSSPAGSTSVTTAGLTTTGAVGLLFAGVKTYNSVPTISATAPLTAIAQLSTFCEIAESSLTAAGTYTAGFTLSSVSSPSAIAIALKEVPQPLVASVTGNSVTEGSAVRFTVTLNATTGSDANYTLAFSGTAVAPTHYNNNFASATFSAGASYVGGQLRVATGYSNCTIDVPTVDNALDQADRTLILTVGGVASTGGLILDNDPFSNLIFSTGTENFGVVPIVATLDTPSGRDITFNVSTVNGTKTAGVDFTGLTNVPVTILAGNLSATVPVTVL